MCLDRIVPCEIFRRPSSDYLFVSETNQIIFLNHKSSTTLVVKMMDNFIFDKKNIFTAEILAMERTLKTHFKNQHNNHNNQAIEITQQGITSARRTQMLSNI